MSTQLANSLVANSLSAETLLALAKREIGAVHCHGFYDPNQAAQAASNARLSPKLGFYKKALTRGIGRIGISHVEASMSNEAREKYFAEASDTISSIESLFPNRITPIAILSNRLQQEWPAGAGLQRLNGQSCFVGAVRVLKASTGKFAPHSDFLSRESSASEVNGLTEQFAANVYLQVPPMGGCLQLWLREPTPEEVAVIATNGGLNSNFLETPALQLRPKAGDLILFNSRLLHSVSEAKGSDRVAMAAFIGYYGEQRPLTYWS